MVTCQKWITANSIESVFFQSRAAKWKSIFTGVYKVDHFDGRLEDFLDSLGLAGHIFGPIVRSAQIHIGIRQPNPRNAEKLWTLTQFHNGTTMELFGRSRRRLISAQQSNNFGYGPSPSISVVLQCYKHNGLPLWPI